MRTFFPAFVFLFAVTLSAFGQEPDPGTVSATPMNFKTRAIEETLQYGAELRLRHDFDQAAKLYKHVLRLDPCNQLARAALSSIAETGYTSKDIKTFIDGLKCVVPPPPVPAPVVAMTAPSMPVPSKTATIQVKEASPTSLKIDTTPVTTPHPPFQEKTLQEKIADLENQVQRAQMTARDQSTRLNQLSNKEPLTQN